MPSYLTPADVMVVGHDALFVAQTMNALHLARPDLEIQESLALGPALEALVAGRPAVLVFGPLASPKALDHKATWQSRPELRAVFALDDPADELGQRVRDEAGAEPFEAFDTDGIVGGVLAALAFGGPGAGPEDAAGPPSTDDDPDPGVGEAEVAAEVCLVVVTAAKGGVGTTTVAVNLAAALAAATADVDSAPRRIALVDAHKTLGDVGLLLDRPRATGAGISDIDVFEIDTDSVLHFTTVDPRTGVSVVLPPSDGTDLEPLTAEQLLRVLIGLGPHADIVVVDAPLALAQHARLTSNAGAVLLVTSGNLASLKNTLIGANVVGRDDHVRAVVNTIAEHVRNPDTSAIEDSLRVPVIATLPFDDGIADGAGAQPAHARPNEGSRYGKELARLARDLLRDLAPPGAT